MTTPEIKTLDTGTIDMTFYRQQAEQARAEAISAGFHALGRWIAAKRREWSSRSKSRTGAGLGSLQAGH